MDGDRSRLWGHPPGGAARGPGHADYYLEPLDVLADERRVVRYDQLGCGRSDLPDDRSLWTTATFVEDLHRLTSHLGLGSFHLLGHSWGAMLALSYAAAHPTRVASLTLASPLVSVSAWCLDAGRLVQALPEDVRRGLLEPPDSTAYRVAEAEFYRRRFCRLEPWPESLQRTMDELGTGPYHAMWGPNEFTQTGEPARGRPHAGRARSGRAQPVAVRQRGRGTAGHGARLLAAERPVASTPAPGRHALRAPGATT